MLIRGRAVLKGPERETLHRPGPLRVGTPADVAIAVALHRAIDRHAVPVLQDDTGLERAIETAAHFRDDVGRGVECADHLDEERKRGNLARQRARSRIPGMRVPKPRYDVRQLVVEAVVGQFLDLRAEDAQALDRIESVACALEWQVGVDAVEDDFDAVDQSAAVRRC